MNKWIIACLCLATCFALGEGPFVVEGVGYQEVKLGKTPDQIIQALGEPEERTETIHLWLVWRKTLGIDVIFPGGTAREIRFNPGFKGTMANGIGIGSEMDAVLKAYGQPNNTIEVGSSENAFADQTLYVLPMGYKILYGLKGILFWFDTNKKVIQFVIATPNSNCGVNPNPGPTITVGDPTPPPELKGLVTLKKPYPQSYAGAETDRISVQYAVMEIVRQVGLGYYWDASFANTNPTCRKWVYPAIENKPCDEALREILTPVGLGYITKGKQVILVMGNGGGNQADGATPPATTNTPPTNATTPLADTENLVHFNVKANMDGALVYIDGVNVGKAGDELVAAKGQHICTVVKQGYMDFTAGVNLTKDGQTIKAAFNTKGFSKILTSFFDGKSLAGWRLDDQRVPRKDVEACWSVKDSCLNFECGLTGDFFIARKEVAVKSNMLLIQVEARGLNLKGIGVRLGGNNIWRKMDPGPNKWYKFRVIINKNEIQATIDGQKEECLLRAWDNFQFPFALEAWIDSTNKVHTAQFRNIYVVEILPDQMKDVLSGKLRIEAKE